MDIIASHRDGLIAQLDADAAALAGRAADFTQRAMVLHHLYDHSLGGHRWALTEAVRSMVIVGRLSSLEKRMSGWTWTAGQRARAREAFDRLNTAMGETARVRTYEAYRAYRLTAAAALRVEAERALSAGLLAAHDRCHAARRVGVAMAEDDRAALEASCAAVADPVAVSAAEWGRIEKTRLGRAARRLVGQAAIDREVARRLKRGWPQADRRLRADPSFPAAFRTNPAQHFYALQRTLSEKRRQRWREEADRDDAVSLAA